MKKLLPILPLLLLTTACGLQASAGRVFDPDAEFAKLDQPQIDTVDATILQSAKQAEQTGEFERAAQFYKQLLDKDTTNASYMLGVANNVRRAGDVAEADALYRAVLEREPNNLDAKEGSGLAQMALGNTVEAGKILADVLAVDSRRWRTLNALGVLFTSKGLTDEAIAYFKAALDQYPRNPSILNNIGLAYGIDGNYPLAIKQLESASRYTKPDGFRRQQVDLNLALIQALSGDMKTAESVAARYLEGPALDNNLGLYAYLADDEALAKSYLNGALSNSPAFYERAWENLALVESASDSEDSANRPDPRKQKRVKIK